jgi:excisionase family DNA binding protein
MENTEFYERQNMNNTEPATLSVAQAARLLGVSRAVVYEAVKGPGASIRAIRLGRRIVIPRVSLEATLSGDSP